MRKELQQRAEKYAKNTEFPFNVYFNRNVPDARYKTEKYFFKYHNTHAVAEAFTTQKELDDFLADKGY